MRPPSARSRAAAPSAPGAARSRGAPPPRAAAPWWRSSSAAARARHPPRARRARRSRPQRRAGRRCGAWPRRSVAPSRPKEGGLPPSGGCGGDRWRGLRRSGGRAVVELLLRPEQQVEHLRAQILAKDQREPSRDGQQQKRSTQPAFAPAGLLGALLECARSVPQGLRRLAQLALALLVLEARLTRRLAVAHAPICAAGRAVCRKQTAAQILVLDQTL